MSKRATQGEPLSYGLAGSTAVQEGGLQSRIDLLEGEWASLRVSQMAGFSSSAECSPLLDESSLPDVYQCGLNMPSPDLLTPQRAASTIWSWAPGEPSSGGSAVVASVSQPLLRWKEQLAELFNLAKKVRCSPFGGSYIPLCGGSEAFGRSHLCCVLLGCQLRSVPG